jgi:DnaD/phage-associated family protein
LTTINPLSELVAFDRWLSKVYLPSASQLLWIKLFLLFNRSGWPEWIRVDNATLMAQVQIKREGTFIAARDRLIQAGLIGYQRGHKGAPSRYKLLPIGAAKTAANTAANTATTPRVDPDQTPWDEDRARVYRPVFEAFEGSICPLTPITRQALAKWVDAMGAPLVSEAIAQGAALRARTPRYIARILEDWQRRGVRAVEQARLLSAPAPGGGGLTKKLDFAKYQAQRAYTPEQMGALYDDPEAL